MATCAFEGCKNPAAPRQGGYCYGHVKQRQRKGRMSSDLGSRHKSKRDMVLEAHHNLEDTDPFDKEAYERAWDRLRIAWWRYHHSPQQRRRRQRRRQREATSNDVQQHPDTPPIGQGK